MQTTQPSSASSRFPSHRPPLAKRHFSSPAVEEAITRVAQTIADPEIAWLFENCFPNTLDTTVTYREDKGRPDTYVITGDIDAMWLRDSSAQVWPYLPLTKKDPALKKLLAGVINRQVRNILLDPYANAFFDDEHRASEWSHTDDTLMKPGVHERKWEVDSLCYVVRLAHGYWKTTEDKLPFDDKFVEAMQTILATFRDQQRKTGNGNYSFTRRHEGMKPFGPDIKANGLICSRFRPSDDPTVYQFLIPSNFFAVAALREMAELFTDACGKPDLAKQANDFADEVDKVLRDVAVVENPKYGKIFAFELDGLGHSLVMDDSNVPSLLSMPYLAACDANDLVYLNTRKFILSDDNPWFFQGKYKGVGGPHCGKDMIWPMALIMQAITSTNDDEIRFVLNELKSTHAGTGFMHESFNKDSPKKFTRHWFAWANTLFGELILKLDAERPDLLK